jgi:preprotein translocase subunit SecY
MFANIANTFANCFKIPELKSRILFTLLILVICRMVAILPVPGLNGAVLSEFFAQQSTKAGSSMMGMYSMFTGGAMERCAIGALGIMPYISATIIIQLLTAVMPNLSKLAREEGGRTKIIQYGRYLTVLLCLGQGFFMSLGWEHPETLFGANLPDKLVMLEPIWWYRIQTTLILTTGTMLMMWLGEQISDRGIGNGVSLIITIGILARLPAVGQGLKETFFPPEGVDSKVTYFHAIALIILAVTVVAGVIAVTQAQRKIPVQYAQRTVGRKSYAGTSSFMPLRVNYSGVMPIIFAQAILMFPDKILSAIGTQFNLPLFLGMSQKFREGEPVYLILYGAMILFFSYFWVATQFNELQISDDLKKYGGYIPGVRPGQATSNYLHNAMSRITLAGAVFLTIIAVVPILLTKAMPGIPYMVASFFGGTSILIMVGVLLDTMRMVESHLLMRHYDGFLKKGRLRGRF